ncbi:hypothetical protein DICPUDRAFT_37764 [Dictyostelium purpureum]|uniref:C-CAP/cofactor C-like domain-containing protein n=1 Tax=Dictyostelium purpureum TaxID=5786 RepID=F0ZTE0_DICPU|nr:uncharacterized protein DICPUDRAFT_37764 [Dictyostelium purpureum]EGC32792.1 hypothetical protein DICPUDRAFT_37764 [Dictyostelium purpureum]|eukprot:XP_003290680.1 hypothetical protein DICPUDRAFT_37764 [Dictyostelium purpureum]
MNVNNNNNNKNNPNNNNKAHDNDVDLNRSNNDDNFNNNSIKESKLTTFKKQFHELEQQRLQSKLEKRKISNEEQIDQSSTTTTSEILRLINNMSNEIEERLNQILSVDKEKIKSEFDLLEEKLSDINSITTLNSHILTQYDIKSILDNIENLKRQIEKSKEKNLPKQKLSLTRKKPTANKASPTITNVSLSNNIEDTNTPITNPDKEPIFSSSLISGFNNETLHYPPKENNINNNENSINDLLISNLNNCKIYLDMKFLTALKINNLNNCTIIGYSPIDGSIFIDSCKESTFVLVSRQLRIHYCLNCQFNIFVKSNPIIEGCKEMKFSSFNSYFKQQESEGNNQQIDYSRFSNYSFDLENNNIDTDKWKMVNDFDWLQSRPSPNWSILN